MTSLTGWVLDHKRVVVAVWVVITIAAFAAVSNEGARFLSFAISVALSFIASAP